MTECHSEFTDLMERVRDGSEDAVQQLLDAYGSHIIRAVRRRLNRQLRTHFDSQDFAQAVWASFFRNRETIGRFQRPDELAAFLGSVAGNKVIDEVRRCFEAKKRDMNRDRSLESTLIKTGRMPPSKTPSPSQIAVAKDELDHLVKDQPAEYRQVVELRASGATFREIAEEMGINEKTARRILGRLSRRAQENVNS